MYKFQTPASDHTPSTDHPASPVPLGRASDPPLADMGPLTSGGPITDSTLDLGLDIDALAAFKDAVSPDTFAMFFDSDDGGGQKSMGASLDS